MWRNFIEKYGGKVKHNFPLSTLAHISDGYSAGSILNTCEKVLTEYRVKQQDQRPLTLPEFIGPLSMRAATDQEKYQEFLDLTDFLTGDKKRREALAADLNGDDLDDLVISHHTNDKFLTNQGTVHVFYGGGAINWDSDSDSVLLLSPYGAEWTYFWRNTRSTK